MRALIDGDVLLHATLWETTNETKAIKKLLYNIEDYTLGAFCDDYIIAVGPYDGKNFRDDIFPEYKQTGMRVKGRKERPEHFIKVKEFLYSLDSVAVADNLEADDLLGIWSTQDRNNSVIVTVDKDMDQLPGTHYNPRKDSYYIVNEEEAKMFFLKQLLMGDPMDNIPGLPKLGPIKAEKIMSSVESSKAAAAVVLDHYFLVYGEMWLDYFLSNGKLLWLQRSEKERFTFENFKRDFLNDHL